MTTVDFATFCYSGDGHRLHKPGQLQKQVESNGYQFNKIYIIHQLCEPTDFENPYFCDFQGADIEIRTIKDLDDLLHAFAINTSGQYVSDTDQAHHWKYHVVNHLDAISKSTADFIVFADNDCWMVEPAWWGHQRRAADKSWVDLGIRILENRPEIFIVSPNDGEPERDTRRMSQQMFMASVEEFRWADFNQPGWDGNVDVPGGPMPEYYAMLEGRMMFHCQHTGQYRCVLGPEYRYWHHNRLRGNGHFETDRNKY